MTSTERKDDGRMMVPLERLIYVGAGVCLAQMILAFAEMKPWYWAGNVMMNVVVFVGMCWVLTRMDHPS